MAKRMKILKTVNLSSQNKYKATRKFMGQNFNFWSASQRYTCKNIATSNPESVGCVSQVFGGCVILYMQQSTPRMEAERTGPGVD